MEPRSQFCNGSGGTPNLVGLAKKDHVYPIFEAFSHDIVAVRSGHTIEQKWQSDGMNTLVVNPQV